MDESLQDDKTEQPKTQSQHGTYNYKHTSDIDIFQQANLLTEYFLFT